MATTEAPASSRARSRAAAAGKAQDEKTDKKTTRTMSDSHKAAIAEGREQARIVGRYLEYVETHRPKRGRKPSRENRELRLETIETELAEANGLERLSLLQEKKDLAAELAAGPEVNSTELEEGFVKVAKPFAERKGYTKATFVEFGVKPEILKAAGF